MKNEDLQVQLGMRDYAAKVALTHTPPPATQVWLRAQHRRNRAALKRAERPIRIMQALAIAYILVIAAWLTERSAAPPGLTLAKTPLLLAVCATIATSLAVCWTMLRASHRMS